MNIKPPGSMTAASCTACSWIANNTKSAGSAVVAAATKIANLVVSKFQSLSQYASVASGYAKSSALIGLNALKANPQIALGSLAALALATAAAYAYKHRAAI